MARVHLLLCFTLLFVSVNLLNEASASLKLKPSLPKIEDPKTLGEVEGYTVQVVTIFVADLEKECPKTSKFKTFFDKLRGFAKFLCPLNLFRKKDDAEVKEKEDGILKTIASFAVGRIKSEIQEEKEEAIETFKFLKTLGGKILGGRKKEEKEALTPEQLKEIKDGILKWQTVITKITNTMVTTTTTTTNEGADSTATATGDSSSPNSGGATGSPSNKPSAGSNPGAGTPSKDTNKPSAGSNPGAGSPSEDTEEPSAGSNPGAGAGTGNPSKDTDKPSAGSNPGAGAGAGTPSKDTDEPSAGSNPGAGTGTPSKGTNNQSNSASSGTESTTTSQTKEVTVTEVETQTSEQVMTFLMNLEKKCPPKDEYKQFFEQLKSTMTGSAKVSSPKRKGLFGRIKGAVGKIGDTMKFIRSRITGKSAEAKKSMETFQTEIIKSMEELNAIHAKIVAQNQSKKGGAMTCTPEQQAEIKTTITKWEQVTTQFVEVAIKSESSTTSSTETSSTGKAQAQAN
ncbi:unnamed protein product [Eruca vesicaria subsp. sativa]|uniref:DUF1216 domain-containing protein n=1 Tax=Eruca vesicaria subsp. sativa TaxID=29727 RepID=A0ABC8JXX2_ERUVS|nr:unnamed protein product [Eruca vesicaria subsp. sativa]